MSKEKVSLSFGFASRRPTKEKEAPKFDFPYVEMLPASEEKGSIKKLILHNGVIELLGFDSVEETNRIAYVQNSEVTNEFYLANINLVEGKLPSEHKLNKDGSFNSSALHTRICEELKLDSSLTYYFGVETIDAEDVGGYEGMSVVRMQLLIESDDLPDTEVEEETATDTVDNSSEIQEIIKENTAGDSIVPEVK